LKRQGMSRLVDEQGNFPAFSAGNTRAEDQNGFLSLQVAIGHGALRAYQHDNNCRVVQLPLDFFLMVDTFGWRAG
jgi:hypothetical protein